MMVSKNVLRMQRLRLLLIKMHREVSAEQYGNDRRSVFDIQLGISDGAIDK